MHKLDKSWAIYNELTEKLPSGLDFPLDFLIPVAIQPLCNPVLWSIKMIAEFSVSSWEGNGEQTIRQLASPLGSERWRLMTEDASCKSRKFPIQTPKLLARCALYHLLIPSRALWGSWAQSLSVSPISLITGNSLHSASMTFPEFQWADSSSC